GFRSALKNARAINTRSRTIGAIEKMKHATLDHSSVPEHVHTAVIGNMGKIALAHMIRATDLFHHDVIEKLAPVAQEYDAITVQQHEEIHARNRHQNQMNQS